MTAKKGFFLYLMLSYEAACDFLVIFYIFLNNLLLLVWSFLLTCWESSCFEWGFSLFSGQEKLAIVVRPSRKVVNSWKSHQTCLQFTFWNIGCTLCCYRVKAVPLYLSEMVPTHLRGSQNLMFHLATAMGIFTANMINYGIGNLPSWGWRLSLGLAALPAIIMTVGGLLLPETPNSLIERGSRVKGRQVLERIRGTKEVDAEFENIVDASELANSIKHPWEKEQATVGYGNLHAGFPDPQRHKFYSLLCPSSVSGPGI